MQSGQLRRREFITLISGAAAAWPLAARAQQPMPVVGFLFSGAQQGASAAIKRAFDQGLSDEGYVEGQNVIIKYKWAEGHYDRLPALAADLGSQRVAVLAVGGGTGPILAVKTANPNVPIVFLTGTDPVVDGLVASFNRPAGNLTGVYVLFNELIAKQMEVLHELVPAAETIAILDNSANPSSDLRWQEMQKAGGTLGVKVLSINVGTERELDFGLCPPEGSASWRNHRRTRHFSKQPPRPNLGAHGAACPTRAGGISRVSCGWWSGELRARLGSGLSAVGRLRWAGS